MDSTLDFTLGFRVDSVYTGLLLILTLNSLLLMLALLAQCIHIVNTGHSQTQRYLQEKYGQCMFQAHSSVSHPRSGEWLYKPELNGELPVLNGKELDKQEISEKSSLLQEYLDYLE